MLWADWWRGCGQPLCLPACQASDTCLSSSYPRLSSTVPHLNHVDDCEVSEPREYGNPPVMTRQPAVFSCQRKAHVSSPMYPPSHALSNENLLPRCAWRHTGNKVSSTPNLSPQTVQKLLRPATILRQECSAMIGNSPSSPHESIPRPVPRALSRGLARHPNRPACETQDADARAATHVEYLLF